MRYSPDDIRRHLQAHRTSGLSIFAYCKQHGVNYWTFREWRKRRFPADSSSVAPQFVKLDLPQSSVLEVVTGSGATIRIPAEMDSATAARLLYAVKRSRIV